MLTILASVLLAQGPRPQFNVPPSSFLKLGVPLVRQRLTNVNRDWVRLDAQSLRLSQSLAKLLPYGDLDAQLVTKIDGAGIPIESQGARGTCTIFATKFLTEYELARQANFKLTQRLNPEYLNWAANEASGDKGDGSSFPAVVDGLREYGCTGWNDPKVYGTKTADYSSSYKPSNDSIKSGQELSKKVGLIVLFSDQSHVVTDARMKTIVDLLELGYPVAVGQQWPAAGAWKSFTVGGNTLMDGTGEVKGAHTMPIVGYKKDPKAPGGGYFLFRNSWGESWGAKGYHFMSFDWVKNHTYDACIAVSATWVKP